jgi:hypothetical protein
MIETPNIRYLREQDMPAYANCGTLVISKYENHISKLTGKTTLKETQLLITPKVHICPDCGLVQQYLNKDELKAIFE